MRLSSLPVSLFLSHFHLLLVHQTTHTPGNNNTLTGDCNIPVPQAEKMKARAPRVRRGSVSAEADKGGADANFIPPVIPKSKEQSYRINKSIANNLLFSSLDDAQRKTVIDAMDERKTKEGEAIIKQGDAGDYFYVVDSGIFSVTLNGVNDGKPVLHYESGNAFGELALMYNCPRAATVTCDMEGCLWSLDRATFKQVVINSMSGKRKRYEAFLDSMKILEVRNSVDMFLWR